MAGRREAQDEQPGQFCAWCSGHRPRVCQGPAAQEVFVSVVVVCLVPVCLNAQHLFAKQHGFFFSTKCKLEFQICRKPGAAHFKTSFLPCRAERACYFVHSGPRKWQKSRKRKFRDPRGIKTKSKSEKGCSAKDFKIDFDENLVQLRISKSILTTILFS